MDRKRWIGMGAALLLAGCNASEGTLPDPPSIGSITAEPDVHTAVISFHVSGGLESVRESGVEFGIADLDAGYSGAQVRADLDPALHDFIVIELQNLSAATRYYYRVFIGNGRSRIDSDLMTFTTKPALEEADPGTDPGTDPGADPEPDPDPSDWLSFPDEAFAAALLDRFDTDHDGGITAEEAAAATEMDVTGLGLTSLEGLHHFTALRTLACSGNLLREIDISPLAALETLACDPMRDAWFQTTLKTIWVHLDQQTAIEKPEKTVVKVKY